MTSILAIAVLFAFWLLVDALKRQQSAAVHS